MAYGLKIYDASGNILLNVDDNITRHRYDTIALADTDDSVTLPDISGKSTVEFSISVEDNTQHEVSRSGTTISWVASSGNFVNSADSLIFVFLYD